MLSSITPLGERGRQNRWGVTATAHVLASALGGALVGGVLGSLGWVIDRWLDPSTTIVALLAAIACCVGLASDVGIGGFRLPSWHRQVNEDWMARYRGWVYGAGFGFQLGMGVATIVTTGAVYVTFAFALLSGTPATGAIIGCTFGLVRGMTVLATARLGEPSDLRRFHRRLQETAPTARHATVGVLAVAAIVLFGSVA